MKKRLFAISLLTIIIVAFFAAISCSATTFNLYDGVQVFSIDDGVIEDYEPQSVLYHFLDTLEANYLFNPYIYIIARYRSDEIISNYWLIEDDFGRQYNINMDSPYDSIQGTGAYQVIKGQYLGTINNSLDQFTLINAQNNNSEAIAPYKFAYLVVVDASKVDLLDFEQSFIYSMVLDVLNSSNNGIFNTDILFGAIENTQGEWYQKGFDSGVLSGRAQASQDSFNRGVIKGRQDEYDYIVENLRPQWENIAYQSGKQDGYSDGIEAANTFTPMKVPFAVMDAIVTMFRGLLNFELFGINFLSVFGALITISIAIFVFKKVL